MLMCLNGTSLSSNVSRGDDGGSKGSMHFFLTCRVSRPYDRETQESELGQIVSKAQPQPP